MTGPDPDEAQRLLAVYDEQLRTDAETPGALSSARLGPLRIATFGGGRGFVTYQDLGGADHDGVRRLVAEAVAHLEADPEIDHAEWKTRGHDRAPGLHDALLAHGFVAEETESIMLGSARRLDVDVALPDGIGLRRVTEDDDVRTMCAMQDEVFGDPYGPARADALLRRLARGDGFQLWVAESDGEIVSAGRLEPVADSVVAGIWGGATRPQWRGRGIYRALTAARARAALELGRTIIHSDSTEFSRPILERAGLLKVSTTTPYHWRRS